VFDCHRHYRIITLFVPGTYVICLTLLHGLWISFTLFLSKNCLANNYCCWQDEYNNEVINWQHIEFIDNKEALELIAVKPLNILSLVDEESKFPKGTDVTLLDKQHKHHANNVNYLRPKSALNKSFGINHFAGVVFYNVNGNDELSVLFVFVCEHVVNEVVFRSNVAVVL